MRLFTRHPDWKPMAPHQRLARWALVGMVGSQIVSTIFLAKIAKTIVKE